MSRQLVICYFLMMIFGLLACEAVWRAEHMPDVLRYGMWIIYIVGVILPLLPDKWFELKEVKSHRKNVYRF